MQNSRIAIIGGGAAGYFAAIRAAQCLLVNDCAAPAKSSSNVVLFEASKKPLAKVLVSGGGRCNVTHHCFDNAQLVKNYPRGSKELRGAFARFQVTDTISWFAERGVTLKVEADGRMFPVSDNSQTIADCLHLAAAEHSVELALSARVKSITRFPDQANFELSIDGSASESFSSVILATGGSRQGFELAASLGHTIIPPVPSLFTFNVSDSRLSELAGVSFPNAELTLTFSNNEKFAQAGPLLITHWGLSGPGVIKLSALAARELYNQDYRANLSISLLPQYSIESVLAALIREKSHTPKRELQAGSFEGIPKRYWNRILDFLEIPASTIWAQVSKKQLQAIASQLISAEFQVNGKGVFKEEFVTCGGVSLKEVDFRTMQSRICPGLFFAGEVLDIDGITGGFNFQAAWTTGWIAGSNAAVGNA